VALIVCTDYTLLGALSAVLVFSLMKKYSDVLLKPSIAQSSNPYVLLCIVYFFNVFLICNGFY